MENRRIPSGLASLLAVSLLAAATAPRSTAETQDLKRKGADREDAGADPLADFFLDVGCSCAACESRRVPPAVAAAAEAQQHSNGPTPVPDRYAKALALLLQSQEELCRPVPTSPTSDAQAHAWQAAASGIAGAIEALKAYEAFA